MQFSFGFFVFAPNQMYFWPQDAKSTTNNVCKDALINVFIFQLSTIAAVPLSFKKHFSLLAHCYCFGFTFYSFTTLVDYSHQHC